MTSPENLGRQFLKQPKKPISWDFDVYRFKKPEKELVDISSIFGTQEYVNPATVKDYSNKQAVEFKPVHLWKNDEGYHVLDGNHRINAAIARGETSVVAHVWHKGLK